jgi:hypothetical protein
MMPNPFNCARNMMSETFDTNDRKEPKDGSTDEAKRYPDGTVRLAGEEIAKMLERAVYWHLYWSRSAEGYAITEDYAKQVTALGVAKRLIEAATKEKACSAGGTTPTSTPSG